MVKKLVTIDVNDKQLKVSAKPVEAKSVKEVEKTEMEKLGFVEINSSVAAKKSASSKSEKGFEKNVSEGVKRTIKAQTSVVEDYFDFAFKVNSKSEEKVEAKKTVKKASATAKTAKANSKTTTAKTAKTVKTEKIKIDENLKKEQNEHIESVKFDSDAYQIIRVARIGSLFDCDKWAIQA